MVYADRDLMLDMWNVPAVGERWYGHDCVVFRVEV